MTCYITNKKAVYQIHIKTKDGWKAVRPTGGQPYEYEDESEAVRVARICDPDGARAQRLAGFGALTKRTDHPDIVIRVVEVTS